MLTVLLVNYKTPQLLLDCLQSIYKFDTSNLEIIVIDNDSKDETELLLNNKFPKVIFKQMGYNAGFARANNEGIKICKGDNILLLNTDTIILDDAVNKCNLLLSSSNFVAAGVQLLNEDGSPQISGSYIMKGGLNYLLPLPYVGKILKAVANVFGAKKPSIAFTKDTIEIDWINGAFLMVKKEVLKSSGLLDEDFFLYAEEAEWCSRIKKNGKLCILGSLNVLHLQGESAKDAFDSDAKGYFNLFDKKGLQIIVSTLVRIRKQFGLVWFLFIASVYFFTIPVFFIGTLITSIIYLGKQKYSFGEAFSFSINMWKVLKYIPKIILNKPYFYKVL